MMDVEKLMMFLIVYDMYNAGETKTTEMSQQRKRKVSNRMMCCDKVKHNVVPKAPKSEKSSKSQGLQAFKRKQ